jgi:hypothetical protein
MKRFSVVRIFNQKLLPTDAAIFFGKELCKEAYKYDRSGNLYIEDDTTSLSLGLGLAISSTKRVFVFCTDVRLLEDLGIIVQMGVSRCLNIFMVVLSTGTHMDVGNYPSIFGILKSPKGLLFNAGVVTHDYTQQIKIGTFEKDLDAIVPTIKGPLIALVRVSVGLNKKLEEVGISSEKMLKRFQGFLNSEE